MDKIYCRECKHFINLMKVPFSYGPPEDDFERQTCQAPRNKRDTHLIGNSEIFELFSKPFEINKNNDCVWFEPIVDQPSSSSSSSSSMIIDQPSSSSSNND